LLPTASMMHLDCGNSFRMKSIISCLLAMSIYPFLAFLLL
jgi:hypothetical protein